MQQYFANYVINNLYEHIYEEFANTQILKIPNCLKKIIYDKSINGWPSRYTDYGLLRLYPLEKDTPGKIHSGWSDIISDVRKAEVNSVYLLKHKFRVGFLESSVANKILEAIKAYNIEINEKGELICPKNIDPKYAF